MYVITDGESFFQCYQDGIMYFSNSIDEATQYDKQEDGDRMVSLLNKIRYMLRVKTEYRLKKV